MALTTGLVGRYLIGSFSAGRRVVYCVILLRSLIKDLLRLHDTEHRVRLVRT